MAPFNNKVLINVDLGEAYGNFKCGPDEELFPYIDQANIACGFHDALTMAATVRACKTYGIAAGAHPGLPDLQGFGRRELVLSPDEHTANIVYQVGALKGFLDREGLLLSHVKPHGMLYGLCCRDINVARAVMAGVPKGIPVVGLPGTCMERAAEELGVPFWAEMFADVRYYADGQLVIERVRLPWDQEKLKKHVRQEVEEGSVTAIDGTLVDWHFDQDATVTVCCHSDSPGCVEIVKTTREIVDEVNKKRGFK
ncbi:lactam utilization protein lamB [Capronia coronata CBS 617.96]|uniref:Lactam utilization protein lamB n=1 Tax=Capronia coronata CBS 617.96 TaxID=1182541 RepID=W9XSY6_9EURO|nr:lactam utilization protein lamB [Capronia coronata CBS 617.96]EXJ80440.1 lactam utilization protein lamB [Capronia coronata CBS 617.96]